MEKVVTIAASHYKPFVVRVWKKRGGLARRKPVGKYLVKEDSRLEEAVRKLWHKCASPQPTLPVYLLLVQNWEDRMRVTRLKKAPRIWLPKSFCLSAQGVGEGQRERVSGQQAAVRATQRHPGGGERREQTTAWQLHWSLISFNGTATMIHTM